MYLKYQSRNKSRNVQNKQVNILLCLILSSFRFIVYIIGGISMIIPYLSPLITRQADLRKRSAA